jgi:hypothetical protein
MVGGFIVLAFVLGMVVGFAIMSNMNGFGNSYAVRYYPADDSYYVVNNGVRISDKYADKKDAKKRMEYYKERRRVK